MRPRGRSLLLGFVLAELWARRVRWGHLPPAAGDRLRGEVVPAPSHAATLLILGDSIPWGYGLAHPNDAWPVRLGRLLASRGTPWRVIDVSLPGETTLQGWARWHRDVRPWHPDRVLVAFGLNDCHLQHTSWDDWRWAHVPQGWSRFSRLIHGLRVHLLSPPAPAPPELRPRLTPEQTAIALQQIVTEARRDRVDVWVLTPTPVGPTFHPEWPDAVREYQRDMCESTREAIRRIARKHRIPLVDVGRAMSPLRPTWIQPDGIHLSPAGHERVAVEVTRPF